MMSTWDALKHILLFLVIGALVILAAIPFGLHVSRPVVPVACRDTLIVHDVKVIVDTLYIARP